MACGPRRSATCNGSRSSYPRAASTFVGSRTGFRVCTQSGVTRCGRFASYGAITLERLMCSFPSAAGQSVPSASTDMLRHACGFKLANDGHDTRSLQQYLGHKNIEHTVRYTELAPDRFKDFW